MSGMYFKIKADLNVLQQLRADIEKLKTTLSGMKREADPSAYKALEKQLSRTTTEFNKLSEKAAKTQLELEKTKQKAQQTTNEMGSLQSMLLKIGGTAALIGLGKQIIEVRGEFQQLGIAFETMLGSKEKADQLMKEAITFAAKTPFTLTDVASNIKQLMAMGIATENVMATMKSLGDVAAGVSVPISRVAINYGQVATMGKLQGRELRDFAMAGIPLVDELAKNLGKAKNEITDMVEAGKIGFSDVEKAFQTMAGEGGKFYNLMEKQNASVTGQISNLQDKIEVMMNSIGQANEGLIYGGISGLATLVEHYEEIAKILGLLVVTYGSYRAALISAAVAQKIVGWSDSIRLIMMYRKEMGLATASQQAFNVAAKANPYGLALAAITAIVTAFVLFGKKAKDAKDLSDELSDSISQIGKQQEINVLIEKYDELKDKTKLTDDEQKELNSTIQQLATIFPQAIGQVDEYGKAIDLVADRLKTANKEYQAFLKNSTQQEVDETTKKLQSLIAMREHLLQGVNTGKRTMTVQRMGEAPREVTVVLSEKEKQRETDRINELSKEIDKLSESLTNAQKKLLGLESGTTEDMLKPYADLFKKVSEYTTKQLYDSKAKLTSLLGAGLGSDAEGKIKSQIDAIAERLNLPTVKKQIEQITKAISDSEAKLSEMRAPGSTADSKQIEEQEKSIKDQKEQLEALTGVQQKVTKEVEDIGNTISDLYKQLETADEKDRQVIAARIIELQKEKVLREQIAENAVLTARNEAVPTTIPAKKQTIFTGNVDTIKGVTLELDKLNKKIEETKKKAASMPGVVDPEKFKQFLNHTQEALYTIRSITDEYEEQLGLSEEQAQVMQDGLKTMSGIADIASGNFIQGGAKIVSSFLKYILPQQKTLAEHFENVANNIEKVAKSIDLASETLSSLGIDSSYRSLRSLQNELQNVAESAKDLNKELGTTQYGHRRDSYSTINKVMEQRADLEKEIEALSQRLLKGNLSDDQRKSIEAVLESYNSVLDQIDGMIADLIGTSVSDLNDSLVDAFFDGEDAAEAWGKKVNDIIADITKKQLVAKFLTEPVNEAIDQLVKDYADSNLSVDELQKFEDAMNEVYQSAAPAIEQAIDSLKQAGLFPEDDTSQQASSRGFQTMSQDTGDALEGRFAVVQMAVVDTAQKMSIENKNSENMLVYQMKISDQLQQQIDTFGEIKQIQIASMYHLEDIAKYTKVLPGMAEDIKQVKDNTANL